MNYDKKIHDNSQSEEDTTEHIIRLILCCKNKIKKQLKMKRKIHSTFNPKKMCLYMSIRDGVI